MPRASSRSPTPLGASATIDLTQGNEVRLEDVIKEINSKDIGVTASINANGDGLLLTDTAGGSGKLKVEDIEGTTAADLNIKGTATATTIDGSFEKTITVTANDTLQDVQKKINDLDFGVTRIDHQRRLGVDALPAVAEREELRPRWADRFRRRRDERSDVQHAGRCPGRGRLRRRLRTRLSRC